MSKKGKKDKGDKKDRDANGPRLDDVIGAILSAPEKLVGDSTPRIDYPLYRVEPGTHIKLSDVDPDESEHYKSHAEVADELEMLRMKLVDLQERLFAEHRKSLL